MFDLLNFMKNVRLDSLDQIAVGSVPILILENNATKCVLAKKGIVTIWMDANKPCAFLLVDALHGKRSA